MPRLLLLLAILLPAVARAELDADEAWIRHLPPAVPVRAGYVVITNPSPEAVTIVAAGSPAFARVEFHRSVERDGKMQMQRVESVTIEPGGRLAFEPGGLHLMLIEPRSKLEPGDLVELELRLDDGRVLRLEMAVQR